MRPYQQLFQALNAAEVRYAVAGGLAVVLHGVPRMTFDLDLALDLSEENLRRLVGVLDSEGYRPRLPVPLAELCREELRSSWTTERNLVAFSLFHPARPMEEVDLLLVTDPGWEVIAPSVVLRRLDDLEVPVVGRAVLRAMKLAVGRPKDRADASLLLEAGEDERE